MKDLSIGVTVFTLTALSADRYWAIVCPLLYVSNGFLLLFYIVAIKQIPILYGANGIEWHNYKLIKMKNIPLCP